MWGENFKISDVHMCIANKYLDGGQQLNFCHCTTVQFRTHIIWDLQITEFQWVWIKLKAYIHVRADENAQFEKRWVFKLLIFDLEMSTLTRVKLQKQIQPTLYQYPNGSLFPNPINHLGGITGTRFIWMLETNFYIILYIHVASYRKFIVFCHMLQTSWQENL